MAKLEQLAKPEEKVQAATPQDKVLIDFSSQAQIQQPVVEDKTIVKKDSLIKVPEEKIKKETKYEVIYPGKDRFPPPIDKTKVQEKTEEEFKIDPLPTPEAVPQEVSQKKPFDVNIHKPSPGWYVQIAAVPSIDEVESIFNKVSNVKLNAKVESAAIRNRPYYRVLVGPFTDRNEALDKRLSTKSTAGTAGEPFIRQVK